MQHKQQKYFRRLSVVTLAVALHHMSAAARLMRQHHLTHYRFTLPQELSPVHIRFTVMPTPKYRQDGNDYREYTDAEYAQDELDALETIANAQAATDRAIARQAVLDRIGITADEAALLLG